MPHLMRCSNGHLCRTSNGHLRLYAPPPPRIYQRALYAGKTAYGTQAYDLPKYNGLTWDDLHAIELADMPRAIAAIADGSLSDFYDKYDNWHGLNYSALACNNIFSSFPPDWLSDGEAMSIANASGSVYKITCTNNSTLGNPILSTLTVTRSTGPSNTVFDVGTSSTAPTAYSGFPTNIASGSSSISLTNINLSNYLCIKARWGSTSYPTRVWHTQSETTIKFGTIAE